MKSNALFRIPDITRNRLCTPDVQDTIRTAVIGAGSGSGVSLVSGLLAAWIRRTLSGETVALVELGTPYFYEAYGIEKRFLYRDFHPIHTYAAEKKSIRRLTNIEEGINWILHSPDDAQAQDVKMCADVALRLVHNTAGSVCLFDCSGMGRHVWDIASEMDVTVCVLDPLPTKLLPFAQEIECIRLNAPNPVFVVNNMNRGVHRGELKRFLCGIDWIELPHLQAEDLYRAQYSCILPYSIPSVQIAANEALSKLWAHIARKKTA